MSAVDQNPIQRLISDQHFLSFQTNKIPKSHDKEKIGLSFSLYLPLLSLRLHQRCRRPPPPPRRSQRLVSHRNPATINTSETPSTPRCLEPAAAPRRGTGGTNSNINPSHPRRLCSPSRCCLAAPNSGQLTPEKSKTHDGFFRNPSQVCCFV